MFLAPPGIAIISLLATYTWAKEDFTPYGSTARRQDGKSLQTAPSYALKDCSHEGKGITLWRSGDVIDASDMIQQYTLASTGFEGSSFRLSDDGTFARRSWGCADFATQRSLAQGSLIAQKLLTFGGDSGIAQVRQWLLNTPLNASTGQVWATEGGLYHMNGQGGWEASAEYILSANFYAKHSGDALVFSRNPERLACITPAATPDTQHTQSAQRMLVGAPQSSLPASVCSESPATISGWPDVTLEYAVLPERLSQQRISPGKQLLMTVTMPVAFTAVWLPILPRSRDAPWPFELTLAKTDAPSAVLARRTFNSSLDPHAWLSLPVGAALPAGAYTLTLQLLSAPGSSSFFLGPAWLGNARPDSSGGAAMTTLLDAAHVESPLLLTLGPRLRDALLYEYGVFILADPAFRGTATRGVNSGSAYYDLLRMGYKSLYMTLRVLDSVLAYRELQPHLVPDAPENLTTIACDIANDILTQFVPNSTTLFTWIGCTAPGSCRDALPPAQDPTQVPVALQLTADLALAWRVLSRLPQCVPSSALQAIRNALDRQRLLARTVPGLFRTTLTPVEHVAPALWLAYDRWADVYADGYAVEEANQTGDWQLFHAGDGNGSFGLQEENGGILLSTTVFIFQAGLCASTVLDWMALVDVIRALSTQLAQHNSSTPLAHAYQPYLRTPITSSLIERLCEAPRHNPQQRDWWGQGVCAYYKSISWDLPEAGLVMYSFVESLLALSFVAGESVVVVYGTSVAIPASVVPVPLPSEAVGLFTSLSRIAVTGLAVSTLRGVSLSCDVSSPGAVHPPRAAAAWEYSHGVAVGRAADDRSGDGSTGSMGAAGMLVCTTTSN